MLLEIEKIEKEHLDHFGLPRINAGARELGVTYSNLIAGLTKKEILIDRKILSDLAINDQATFKKVVETAVK